MSNYLAVATVAATISMIVRDAMRTVPNLSGIPDVKIARPVADRDFLGAHLFPYRVSPNPVGRNDDLPTRDAGGHLVQRPRYAADVEFLLAFYGKENGLEPQRLLGRVITALHAEPVLSAERVRRAIQENQPALEGSDLDRAAEPVRLTPMELTLEDLARMWSVFYQVPYNLTMAYTASIVWLDAELTPSVSPGMSQFKTSVAPSIPVITALSPPVLLAGGNDVVRVSGAGFGSGAVVLFNDQAAATTAEGGALAAAPPDGTVGTVSVRAGSATAASNALQLTVLPYVGATAYRAGYTPPKGTSGPGVPTAISAALSVRANLLQRFEFLLSSTTTSASAVKPALLTWLDAGFVSELAQSTVSPALGAALRQVGVAVADGDPLEAIPPGAPQMWRIHSAHQDVALYRDDVIVVAYGLADSTMTLACAADELAAGTYAFAVRILDRGGTLTSPLLRSSDPAAFPVAGGTQPVDDAPVADDVRAAFATRGYTIDPSARTRQPVPGNAWLVVGPDGSAVGQLLWDAAATRLDGYALTPSGPVVAPLVAVGS